MPDNIIIDLSDPENQQIEGTGIVSIGVQGQQTQIFNGAFILDSKSQKLRPQAGIILEPRLSIAGFEIVIDEIEIVADIAPGSDPQNDAGVIINGSLKLPTILNNMEISFKGGLSIGSLSGVHFSYGYEVEGIKFGKTGWELKDLSFFYNSATNTIEAKTELKLPIFAIEANLVLKDAALDSIILDVDLSRLPTPILIDSLPIILSRIAGGVENIQGPDPIQIRAGAGVQTYPRAPIRNCNGQFNSLIGLALEPVDVIIDLGGIVTGSGDTYIFKPLNTWECDIGLIKITYDGYHLAQAEVSVDWIKGIKKAKGDLNFFDILVAIAQASVDRNWVMNGSAIGKIQIPRWALCVGGICAGIPGGQTIVSNAIYLDNEGFRSEVSYGKLIVTVKFTSNGEIQWGTNWKDLFNLQFAEYQTDLRIAALGDSLPASGGSSQILLSITQPPGDMVIRLAWSDGDTNFDLITPSGRKLTPVDNPESYFKNPDIHEAFYLINNPEAGDWKAVVYNTDIIGSYEIGVLGRNMPPSITLLSPRENMIKPTMVDIRWQDEDTDDNAMVSLYYDDDNQGVDGVQIVGNILEDDETDQYLWDTTNVPSGTYYIYAKIDDGNNAPRFAYSQGKVTIQRSGAPTPPTVLFASPGEGQISLTWESSPESTVTGYRIYYTDNMAEEMFEHSLAVGNVTQASVSGLANGRSYRVAVTAYDGLGRESLPSESKVVSLISAVRNNIPVITSETVRIAKEYHLYSYDVEAQDADNDSLIYQLITAPQGMSINSETGLIQWIPTRENAGNNYVEIIVDDGSGGIETQKYSVLVETEQNPPITTAIIDPPLNMHGWSNSPVSVHLSATDGPDGTGVKNIFYQLNTEPELFVNGNQTSINVDGQGTHILTYGAVDFADNKEYPHVSEFKIDKNSPIVQVSLDKTPNNMDWYNTDVTLTFTCSDSFSGISTCPIPVIVTTEGAGQIITGTATDKAGNTASTSVTINLDKTPPNLIMPDLGSTYSYKAQLPLNFDALDSGSGVDSMTAILNGVPLANEASVTLTRLGANTFTLSATDQAGNTASRTTTFSVVYDFSGVLQPINPDGSSIFKLGSTVPVKFQLKDANGVYVSTAVAKIYLAKATDGVTGTELEAASTSSADTGNAFRYDSSTNQYIFNLGTKGLSAGTWRIRIDLGDGTERTVLISLKK